MKPHGGRRRMALSFRTIGHRLSKWIDNPSRVAKVAGVS
jgi:hypothetical protein